MGLNLKMYRKGLNAKWKYNQQDIAPKLNPRQEEPAAPSEEEKDTSTDILQKRGRGRPKKLRTGE